MLVPIVHIYGRKELRFILAECGARAYISADHYGNVDYLDIVDGTTTDELPALGLHGVVGSPAGSPPTNVRRAARDVVDGADAATTIATADADDLCVLAYTSGTTSVPRA